MPISQQDLPYVSAKVIFDATKQNSAYLKKVAPRTYRTCEPGNPKSQLIQKYSGISYPKAVDVKANPSGKGVVIVTMDNETCTPKDTFAEETVTAESMKEYHAAVEAACKKAGREDLVRVVFSKVAKLVECDADEE